MAILEQYRKSPPGGHTGYRRAVVLAVLLGLVLVLMLLTGRRSGPPVESIPATPPPPDSGIVSDPSPPAPAGPRVALDPEQERALLAKVIDQAPLGVRENAAAYYYLINKVHRTSDNDLATRLDRSIGYVDYANQPAIVRGSVVRVEGRLLRLERTALDEAVAGHASIYEGQVMDGDAHVYSFALTEPPAPPLVPGRVEIQDAWQVRLTGIFAQIIVYQNRETPPKDIASPLVVGRRLILLEKSAAPRRKPPWALIAFLGLAIVFAAVRLFLQRPTNRMRSRREMDRDEAEPE